MIKRLACLVTAFLAITTPVASEELPLWEIKAGGFGFYGTDYPASGNYRFNGLAYPTLTYRGDTLRIGGSSAAKLVPFRNPRFELGVSLDAAFAADSDGNPIRDGMPDLGLITEFGPELVIKGPRRAAGTPQESAIDFALQARAVFSYQKDDGIDHRGFIIEPTVKYRKGFASGSRFRATFGPVFATEGLQDYYYQVDPTFARAGRPPFDAKGGYLGTEATFGLTVPVTDRLNVWGGGGVGLYSGAKNKNSPLFEDDLTSYVYLGASFKLFQSKRRAHLR